MDNKYDSLLMKLDYTPMGWSTESKMIDPSNFPSEWLAKDYISVTKFVQDANNNRTNHPYNVAVVKSISNRAHFLVGNAMIPRELLMKLYRDGYRYEESVRYMIFAGCFCPPHIGHFNVIKKNYRKFDEVNICIWGGGEGRHGIPTDTSKQIWEMYVNSLQNNDHIHIDITSSGSQPWIGCIDLIKDHMFEGDTVTIFVGSDYSRRRIRDIKTDTANYINNRNVIINVERVERDKYSASNFIKNLNSYKDIRREVLSDIPEGLGDKVIDLLSRYNTR